MTEREWPACTDPVEMLRFVWNDASDRKVLLYLCGGCRHVAHLFYLPESLAAVEVAERFADGLASEQEMGKADWAAEVPTICFDLERAPPPQNPRRAEIIAGLIEKGAVPESVLHGGEWRVDEAVATRLQAAAELAWHCVLPLREDHMLEYVRQVGWPGRWLSDCVFGDPFRTVRPDPAWLAANDGVAPKLAQAIYEERLLPSGHLDPVRLAVLCDALEDAGCNDAGLLGHLRGPGPHVRGCWAVDLLTGRQ